jgi:Gp157 protein
MSSIIYQDTLPDDLDEQLQNAESLDFTPPEDADAEYVLHLARIATNYAAEADAISTRVKELRDKQNRKRRAHERVRDWAKQVMLLRNLTKCTDPDHTVFLSERDVLVVRREDELDEDFVETSVKRSIDKRALDEHYRHSGEIPGGCSIDTRVILTIKG